MEVAEVWFWEDGVLTIYCLRNHGYEKISNTELVAQFPIALFTRYITYDDQYDAVNEFLAAVELG
jgi:hypothetical protein